MNFDVIETLCDFPIRLHPVSQMFLDAYFAGTITSAEFLRFFSLPNSDYIPLGQCLVDVLTIGIP